MANTTHYQLLWECYLSGQMSTKQLNEHIRFDPEFDSWVMEKIKDDLVEENPSE